MLPIYDPLQRLAGVPRLHDAMIDRAELQPGHRVLDVGCGTGNLLRVVGRRRLDVELAGLDPDPTSLRRARRKAARSGVTVEWEEGLAQQLPFPDRSVDRVLSSLMFHHLDTGAKDGMLAEVRRVLRPDGLLVLADIDGGGTDGRTDAGHGHGGHSIRRHLWARPAMLRDNGVDDIVGRMVAAGLRPAAPITHATRLGAVSIIPASVDPAGAAPPP